MKDAIRQRAKELGFDLCRFTEARAPDHAAHFEQWLKDGRHGAMGYLERNAHKRVDPQQVLADAKTILVVAASYWNGDEITASPQHGQFARYARYADYHDVMGDRLKQLSAFVDQLGGLETKSLWYVDTGPLLERDLAQRAGIGFIGKHTNVISRELGNWFFLAEIITTLGVEPDPSEKNRCGSCRRCIDSCPTNAITAPFQLDARRCISYLTIELKDSIPLELRPAIGNRIYGCDDCLAACPWNKFAKTGALMAEHRRADLDQADLLDLLSLDDAAFKQRFAGTPILRTKRRGLLRNVCVALGNVGDQTVLPALERAARDPEPLIVEHALWAIEQIKNRRCLIPNHTV
ncbi:MAG: tRNA epoxyqueuosine(34) reductase QueG [Verrucomicrobiales bacterium]|nr:tRNA epoxyqueuosine(34) reductase QueG [Verrucomicrobiales bacterium]